MQKITPFLWYFKEAEEAATFLHIHLSRLARHSRHGAAERIAQRSARIGEGRRVRSLAIEVAGNIRLGRVIEVLTRLISLGCSGSQARQAPGGSLIRAEKPMEGQSG
jgi:hypothetical protein